MDAAPKEIWDHDVFVRAYDALARERSGWTWPGEIPPEKLQGWYEGSGLWESIRDFALTRYQLDQEL